MNDTEIDTEEVGKAEEAEEDVVASVGSAVTGLMSQYSSPSVCP